jgi:hypothetical protein
VRALDYGILVAAWIAPIGCQQSVTPPPFRSLSSSGRVSLLCREMTNGVGRDMRACPDSIDAISDIEDRHTIALVTQEQRGEVAAVDLHAQAVLDEDPSIPGTEFLPVGAIPTAIASTPGGVATFVGVAEVGREGIFALPTTCITAPPGDDTDPKRKESRATRELTLWSACRLPSRPGEMAIVADATAGDIAGGTSYRPACPSSAATPDATYWWNGSPREDNDCPANLKDEEQIGPAGRRKLLVTLPDEGRLAIFDAQAILNLAAGSFGDCIPDRVVDLATAPPPNDLITQPMPADLAFPDPTSGLEKEEAPLETYKKISSSGVSRPAGIALSDGKIYVADLGVPLIHVVNVKDPCAAYEELPLRPLAYDDPTRAVTTSEVAVSRRTLAGQDKNQKFLYAVDQADGSAMVFDLSDGGSRAPVVRSHVPELPFEPPDRIRFEAPIKKLQLVTHDAPAVDPNTNTAEVGVLCDPYPGAAAPGSLYRTSTDYATGAGPRKFRGTFGVLALGTGQIATTDIEDWDAPCRRPLSNNPLATGVDWLGCAHDETLGDNAWFAVDQQPTKSPTVNDEASCNIVEPHRMRSGRFFKTDTTLGTLAPSLVGFPRLSSPDTGDLATGKSDTDRKHPQMLAVPYRDSDGTDPDSVFLNVGTIRYQRFETRQNYLDVDPATTQNNSLLLPLSEPRLFTTQENFTATYEGLVVTERSSGQLPVYSDYENQTAPRYRRPIEPYEILLHDPDAWFCDQGVEAYDIALETGKSLGLTDTDEVSSAALAQFAANHADFVELTSDFDSADPYFADARVEGSPLCKSPTVERPGNNDLRTSCESWFGTKAEPKATREFTIYEADADDLVLRPRAAADSRFTPKQLVSLVHCCFPTVHRYVVRAGKHWVVRGSGLLTRMRGGANTACYKDKSVRRAKWRSRAYEISSSADCVPSAAGTSGTQSTSDCAIGPVDPNAPDEVCVTDQTGKGIPPSLFGSVLPQDCLFESLKGRFAIYRGRQPSKRDMVFRWTVTGGFSPLSTTIATASTGLNVVPMDMVYSESLDALVVIDGASGGVNLVGLTFFAPLGQPYL